MGPAAFCSLATRLARAVGVTLVGVFPVRAQLVPSVTDTMRLRPSSNWIRCRVGRSWPVRAFASAAGASQ